MLFNKLNKDLVSIIQSYLVSNEQIKRNKKLLILPEVAETDKYGTKFIKFETKFI